MKKQVTRRKTSKKLQAIQTSRHWRFSHSRHTGHVLPRHNTSYPLLLMLVLCTGILLAGWTQLVTADSSSQNYVVHASVPGPAPTQAATIAIPLAGTLFTATPITVSGVCPLNSYIQLYRNNFASGVALCSATGEWQLKTDLFKGVNQLQAKVYNYTDVAGPDSNIVNVSYVPPEPTPLPSSGGGSWTSPAPYAAPPPLASTGSPTTVSPKAGTQPSVTHAPQPTITINTPFTLQSFFQYQGVYTGQSQHWQLTAEGGTAPYALEVQWGDGSHQLISRSIAGSFTISHSYQKAGGYHGSYVIQVTAGDSVGTQSYLQLLAIVNNHPGPGGNVGNANRTPGSYLSGNSLSQGMKYLWPSYAVVLLMLGSFWLGERQEFKQLRPRLKHRPPRHV